MTCTFDTMPPRRIRRLLSKIKANPKAVPTMVVLEIIDPMMVMTKIDRMKKVDLLELLLTISSTDS